MNRADDIFKYTDLIPFIYVSHQINPQVSEPVKLDV